MAHVQHMVHQDMAQVSMHRSAFALVSGLLGEGKYQDPNHVCQAARLLHGCMQKASCRAVNAGQLWQLASCAPFVIIQEPAERSHELC